MNGLILGIVVALLIYFSFRISFFAGIIVTVICMGMVWHVFSSSYRVGRANAEFSKKNYDKAMKLYEKAYKSKNRKFTVDAAYAQALLRMGNTEKSLEIVNALLSRKLSGDILLAAKQTRCLINSKTGNVDEALEEAKEIFYEDGFVTSNTYCLLGYVMLLKGENLKETTEFCEKAYDYDSDNRDNVDNLIVCCLRNGDYERAAKLSDDLCTEHPTFVEAFYHGAQAYLMLGNKEHAKSLAEKISSCNRTFMTTISEEKVEKLLNEF